MFYIYTLKSVKGGKLYIGSSDDLKRRFAEHNSGMAASTKYRGPFNLVYLVYYEAYASEKDARTRERMLKRFSGSYMHLKRRIRHSLIFFK